MKFKKYYLCFLVIFLTFATLPFMSDIGVENLSYYNITSGNNDIHI